VQRRDPGADLGANSDHNKADAHADTWAVPIAVSHSALSDSAGIR